MAFKKSAVRSSHLGQIRIRNDEDLVFIQRFSLCFTAK